MTTFEGIGTSSGSPSGSGGHSDHMIWISNERDGHRPDRHVLSGLASYRSDSGFKREEANARSPRHLRTGQLAQAQRTRRPSGKLRDQDECKQ